MNKAIILGIILLLLPISFAVIPSVGDIWTNKNNGNYVKITDVKGEQVFYDAYYSNGNPAALGNVYSFSEWDSQSSNLIKATTTAAPPSTTYQELKISDSDAAKFKDAGITPTGTNSVQNYYDAGITNTDTIIALQSKGVEAFYLNRLQDGIGRSINAQEVALLLSADKDALNTDKSTESDTKNIDERELLEYLEKNGQGKTITGQTLSITQLKSDYDTKKSAFDAANTPFEAGSAQGKFDLNSHGEVTFTVSAKGVQTQTFIWDEQKKIFYYDDVNGQRVENDLSKFGISSPDELKTKVNNYKNAREDYEEAKSKYDDAFATASQKVLELQTLINGYNTKIENIKKQQDALTIGGKSLQIVDGKIQSGDKIYYQDANGDWRYLDAAGSSHIELDDGVKSKLTSFKDLEEQKSSIQKDKEEAEKTLAEAQGKTIDSEKERQQKQLIAYELTWKLLSLALDEFAYPLVDDICKEETQASEPPNDKPTDTSSGGSQAPQPSCEDSYHAELVQTEEGYEMSYGITACTGLIHFSVHLAGPNVPDYTIDDGYVAVGQPFADRFELPLPHAYSQICVDIGSSARCF